MNGRKRPKRRRCVNCNGRGYIPMSLLDWIFLAGWPCPDCGTRGYYREVSHA